MVSGAIVGLVAPGHGFAVFVLMFFCAFNALGVFEELDDVPSLTRVGHGFF